MALLLANILLAKRTLEPQKIFKQPKENITENDGPTSPRLKKIRDDLLLHVNQSANPCEDFFAYVCGNWVSDLQKSQLQPGEGYNWNYVRDVHNVLINEVGIGATSNVEDAMIVTYKGCVAFMKQDGSSLIAALKIIDVDVQDWLHLPDFATVIVQFVIRAFLAGVPIFLKVRLTEGSLYLTPGDTFDFLYEIYTKTVLNATLNELSLNKGSLLHDLENADFTLGVVKGVKSNISGGGSGFPGMPNDWNKTLVEQLRSKTRQQVERVEVSYEDLKGVFQMLTSLRKESMTVVRVYTLVSLLVPLLSHDYDRKSLLKKGPDKVHFHCVHVTGELFTDFFPHWVARKLQDRRAAEEAERLALNLMELAVDRKRQGKGHQRQSTLFSFWKLHIFGKSKTGRIDEVYAAFDARGAAFD
ncbi:hypothetical protein IscW_ISCW009397 [Ixodes scapularis]|uniref:Peptidase M13 N-terminal domain-containing protein n=1 Tax=Ixodes scapularis TaxID=6945 RepID=B7Q3S1_IXOSC|nr:hypothetical protein IscW_ISCW009397 [Ixodes scapularis]|eukprot:XP_002411369.1 hypothetical protein IscW_ISCW009397 [Ixodes scapularis]